MPYLAPAGTPITFSDISRWVAISATRSHRVDDLTSAFAEKFGSRFYGFLSSGRAAMYLALETLASSPEHAKRNEVIVPAFTCYSVPAAVQRAGLKVRLCDIDPDTLSMDTEKLGNMDFSRTLAIVTANLYGMPNDLAKMERIAAANGVILFDDAAQALGATAENRWVGTFGDLGLFSFDKGKNITSMQGGALVSASPAITHLLESRIRSLPKASFLDTAAQCLKLIVYAALLPPRRYAVTQRIPFLGLGKTPYTTDYPVTRYSPTLSSMTEILLTRLETLNQRRTQNAGSLRNTIQSLNSVRAITALPGTNAVYTRFPIVFESEKQRAHALHELNSAGIGATLSYPQAISDIPELQPHLEPDDRDMPHARMVAARLATLPTHPYVEPAHLELMQEILTSLER